MTGISSIQIKSWFVIFGALALAACGGGNTGVDPQEALEEEASQRESAAHVSRPLRNFGPNVVSLWTEIAADTYNNRGTAPPATAVEQRPIWPMDLATVHLAMYDAAMAIARTHTPYAIEPVAPTDGASIDAAVGAAAHGVLRAIFPGRSATYQPKYDAWLAQLPDDAARARGLAVGAEVAAGIVALRADDGRLVTLPPFVPGTGPGDFRGLNPITPWFPHMKPFVIRHTAQFRADGPPALSSRRYARDWKEVHDLGSATSALRTAEQTEIARSHTESPTTYWPRNFRQFASGRPTVAENARVMAMIWTGMADTLLGCFESKYHHLFWRPASAINFADTDGNDATTADPTWLPLGPVPNHPEYPAAHSCIAGTLSETLRQAFGTRKLTFSFDSDVTDTTHHYASIDEMASELGVARIWGGMHFRTSLHDGRVLGRQTAKYVLRHQFRERH
jgi:PAP2 superfamily